MRNLHRKDNEAFAIGKNVRVSPRKASIVLDTIRGKRVKDAQNILKFSKRAIAQDIYKILSSAAANAENNHQLDLDVLQISEAYCGKGMVMKRWRARAKGRPGRIQKFLSNITIKVAEVQSDKEESK